MTDDFNPLRGLTEYCGVSTSSGKCMWGDRESRDEVLTWRHSHSIVLGLTAEIARLRAELSVVQGWPGQRIRGSARQGARPSK